ncbi:MAG: glycoside hydrolase family 43 protein [bacterium]|nr:glycoside hydrolase family 43 protein [bacterium]
MSAYLFVHFIGEQEDGEQIHFSISKDGLHWKDLNRSKPILYSHVGEKGVRDPFIVRHPKTKTFYLIATDLRIASKKGWDAAIRQGSKSIIVWESKDLIHWSEERSCQVGVENAGCVWAPEAIYDQEKEAFLVFWASKIWETDAVGKHKIFGSYTNDFKTFTEPFVFLEKDCDVIDSTIIKEGDTYYRFTKDETESKVILEASKQLTGTYKYIESPVLRTLDGVEGPECFLLPDKKTWCLIVDQFAKKLGYRPFLVTDLKNGQMVSLETSQYDFGASKKRHGGIIELTEEEYERLEAHW